MPKHWKRKGRNWGKKRKQKSISRLKKDKAKGKKNRGSANRAKSLSKTKQFAIQLQANPPKSDRWFQELYKEYKHKNDNYNEAFGKYIPDMINKKYKYIVEVDGSYHDRPDQQEKDKKKNSYFMNRGYIVFRIPAYNEERFKVVLEQILNFRHNNK